MAFKILCLSMLMMALLSNGALDTSGRRNKEKAAPPMPTKSPPYTTHSESKVAEEDKAAKTAVDAKAAPAAKADQDQSKIFESVETQNVPKDLAQLEEDIREDIWQTGMSNEILGIVGLTITIVSALCSIFCCLEGTRAKISYSKVKSRFRRQQAENPTTERSANILVDNPLLTDTINGINKEIFCLNTKVINLENLVMFHKIECNHKQETTSSFTASRPTSTFGTGYYEHRPPLASLLDTSNTTLHTSISGAYVGTEASRKTTKFAELAEKFKPKKSLKKGKKSLGTSGTL